MTWWQALILGIVEGLTEYLPISSTGHLLLTMRALGIPHSDEADAFAICIQAGAIVAVVGLYWQRMLQLVLGAIGRNPVGRRILLNVVLAFIPAVILGGLGNHWIKAHLFGGGHWGLWPIVIAWVLGGAAILVVTWWRRRSQFPNDPRSGLGLDQLSHVAAIAVGIAQCLAMWPGTSRSLVTIVGGVLAGLSLPAAVEFSFLLGVLTLSAAAAKDGLDHGHLMVEKFGAFPLLIGFLAAWLAAVLAVRWMVNYLSRHGLAAFGWYRVILGVVVALLILGHFLQ